MTDKEKFRKEVEKLKSNLMYGACSSQVAMETRCKEEAYNEVLAILDTMQEEPVSIWHDASEEPNGDNSIVIAYDNGCTVEPSFKDFKSYSEWGTIKKSYRVKQWAYVNDVLNLTNKEEPVSDDLEEEIEKYFDALYSGWTDSQRENDSLVEELCRKIAIDFAKWHKEQMMAKAIDAEVLENYDGKVIKYDETLLDEKLSDCKVFDKVKVIIIKED